LRSIRRIDSSDKFRPSPFEEFRKNAEGKLPAVEAIENLIQQAQAQYIVLSYSSGSRATAQQLHDVLLSQGQLMDVLSITHKKNVMAEMKWTNEWTNEANEENKEYFFLLEKQ